MRAIVTTEAHFTKDPAGVIRSDTGGRSHEFWSRYLEVFDSVGILARVTDVDHSKGFEVVGPDVEVLEIPGYGGLIGTLKALPRTRRFVGNAAVQKDTAYIARVPSLVGALLVTALKRSRTPYALEVVGDPYEVFKTGVSNKIVDPILRRATYRSLRRECAHAVALSYVTESQLQTRYPAHRAKFVTNYSSVHLPDAAFANQASQPPCGGEQFRLVSVGTQSQKYKGHDLSIQTVANLRNEGIDVSLTLVGDGKYRLQLESLARELGVTQDVSFAGRVPSGPGVIAELDRAHLFLMPSLTEGLPRALIEAMARGLPCVASRVGGIPELLLDEDLFKAGDAAAVTESVRSVFKDPERMKRMAERNLIKANEYHEDVFASRRRNFFEQVERLSSVAKH